MAYIERTNAAYVTRHNGAWLVGFVDMVGDATSDALYDCASNLTVAKRIAVAGAREFGFEGTVRWSRTEWGGWVLEMVYEDAYGEEEG